MCQILIGSRLALQLVWSGEVGHVCGRKERARATTHERAATHERATLEEITKARAGAEGARQAGKPAGAGAAESHLSHGIGRLLAIVEAYPDLRASDGFRQLHRSLVEVEDKLQNARRYYNAVVRDLNTRIQSVPDLVVASLFGFEEREFFELDSEAEAAVPRVELS